MENKIIVLGAGIAGISAGYHINPKFKVTIYEKNQDWGGMCGGFNLTSPVGNFWFDHAVHLSFAENHYVQEVFHNSSQPIRHIPKPMNYYKGHWIKHPAQNNLYPLPLEEKVLALKDMIHNHNPKDNINNFEQWLRAQYGDYFTENFPMCYTEKYWTTEAKNLSTSWVGKRLYTPNLEEILYGAMSPQTPNTYYAKEMRYPKEGQYRSFFRSLREKVNICFNKEVVLIDTDAKKILFKDGTEDHYTHLVSTLPLKEITKIIKNTPEEIIDTSLKLHATSVALVSLGFNRNDIPKELWFYIYDKDKLFARVYSPSFKSPKNAPNGCSSLQAEIYFSSLKGISDLVGCKTHDIGEYLIWHTKEKFIEMGICKAHDIICEDFRIIPYANVIFTHDMENFRNKILDFLKSKNIVSCGRFGEWDYLWSDQSFLSGYNAVQIFNR
ncbi:NAD(P)-binding protein [Helicobacter sp. faydin-H20]|uniref:protoporphyrinogen/coproporphyrinogen oxidase n=1 Tax=Helicobacter anatolicus TaxID=2905874 RepID=UPI001E421C25|nr:NAD(P)-binding protein [Helicobacter anatolicus]MCE3036373.1 NAD(P)-binding protein [Helicobacter anatolicus]